MLALILWVSILINEVFPAPSSGPEWVELYNTSDTAVDVSGWRIDDDTPGGTQTTIPTGSIVAPHAVLAVAINTAILNNTGDSAVLLDASGAQVDRIDFGAMKSTESMARIPDGATFIVKGAPSIGALNATTTATATLTAIPATATTVPSATATTIPSNTATTIPSNTATTIPSNTATTIPSNTATTIPSNTATPSSTKTPSDTTTPSFTKTPSPTKTPSETDTPSVTKTPPATTTGSPSKTASITRTASMTKTPSVTRTPSITKTVSPSKTISPTKTPSETHTVSPTKTPSETRTLSPTKTPSDTRTPSRTRTKSNVRVSLTPTTLLMRMRINQRTPALILCAPLGQSLVDWTLKSHDATKVITTSQIGCQTIQWPSTVDQVVTLYNPHDVQMVTIDMAQTACQLDMSTCQPSATATVVASPVLVWDSGQTVQATPTRMHEDIVYKGSGADFPDGATVPMPPPPIHDGAPQGVFFIMGIICLLIGGGTHLWLARTPTPVLYSQSSDEAESSDQRVSSESRSV